MLTIMGLLLVVAGILIAVYPELLSWIVAASLIISGISLMHTNYRIRKFFKS